MTQDIIETAREDAQKPSAARRRRPAAKDERKTEPKRQTKKHQLIRLLSGKTGAEVATISHKLGWQQHTTRAALTHLRKAGYEIAAEKPADGKPGRYRITGMPEKT